MDEEILRYIISYIHDNGYSPSIREIMTAVGFKSTNSVWKHLKKMRSKGMIENNAGGNMCRTIQVPGYQYMKKEGAKMNEFSIEWESGRSYASVTAPAGSHLRVRILNLQKKYPNKVKVIAENPDGSIFAHIPVSFVKINPSRNVSDKKQAKPE